MDQPAPYHPPLVPPAYARAVSGRVRTGETWAIARQMYADGATASEVMERLGIGRSAFYERARREGWLRRDQIDEPLRDEYDLNPDQLERGAAEMAVEAWACVCRAIDRGRLAEARGWTRVFRELREVAVAQAKGAMVVRLPGDGGPVETAYVPAEQGRPDLTGNHDREGVASPSQMGRWLGGEAEQTEGSRDSAELEPATVADPASSAGFAGDPSVTPAAPARHLPTACGRREAEPDSPDGPDSFSGVRSPGLSPPEPGSSR